MSPSHISSQYGELRPTSGWTLLPSLGHPCKFQPVSRLGSVTARHFSSGRQPNFAALNRGRHLYSAGRPSRWTFAHISGYFMLSVLAQLIAWKRPSLKCVERDISTCSLAHFCISTDDDVLLHQNQTGLTFLVTAYPGCTGKEAIKRVSLCGPTKQH